MNSGTIWAVFASAFLAAAGQVLLKIGANGKSNLADFVNLSLLSGLSCYIFGILLWIYSLSRMPLSSIYPFTFLTFVLVGVGSAWLLGDVPSLRTVVGWTIILVGIGFVALSN